MLTEIRVSLPPLIADLDPVPDRSTREATEAAQIAAVRLDATSGPHLAALSGFLLRSESVASSRIERINPDPTDSARALAGLEAGRDAQLVASAAAAVSSLISSPTPLAHPAILTAHELLLGRDRQERRSAGSYRTVQNWIGGSHFTPRNAIYTPPPADLLPHLMDDLIAFARRADFGSVAQAAVVHAQFESIHPFTDGNGRIGRALINTVLRHRGVTSRVVVPVASVMLADVDNYFQLLEHYREGDVNAFISYLADGIVTACAAAAESSDALKSLPDTWRETARPRANSSAALLIDVLLEHPVVTTASARRLIGTTARATLGGLDHLEENDVITEVTGGASQRIWVAHEVIEELDRLSERIGARQKPPSSDI